MPFHSSLAPLHRSNRLSECGSYPWEVTTSPLAHGRRVLAPIILTVVVLVGLLAWWVLRPAPTTQVEPAPSVSISTPRAPASSPTPPPSPSVAAEPSPSIVESVAATSSAPATTPAGACPAPTPEGFVPVRYEIERLGTDESVVSLGLDGDGAIAAPPKSEPSMASWWNEGPTAGADAGKTVLSIHTYRRGGALGNALFEGGKSALQPGDRITLHGANGEVACYDFVEATKVFVEDYDPSSDVMVDFDGDPLLTMIICWDHRRGTDEWDSRVFFYAKPVVGN